MNYQRNLNYFTRFKRSTDEIEERTIIGNATVIKEKEETELKPIEKETKIEALEDLGDIILVSFSEILLTTKSVTNIKNAKIRCW